MYGFDIIINGRKNNGDIIFNNNNCYKRYISKFENDRLFEDSPGYILLLDGVILNKKSLIKEYDSRNWCEIIILLYEQNGETFFSKLRGSFAGAIYDKVKDKWIIFSDYIGSKFVYYSLQNDFFCVTEDMGHIYSLLKENGKKCTLSTNGAYMLLSFGFMLENWTLCEEVKKLQPGYYLVYEKNKLQEKNYYTLNNDADDSITENNAIDIVDEYFRKAVIQEFEKDREYSYKHIVALSGGLDSRMTSFVAHDCGYKEQLNFTFSQTDYWDEIVPKKIAEDLKHEWIFKSLDNGLWLYDVDRITNRTGGNVIYYGTAHGDSLYRLLNFNDYGIVHTGQISGALNGSHVFHEKDKDKIFDLEVAAYSRKFLSRLNFKMSRDWNQELGWYYYRCLNGTNNGSLNVYNYSETLSPFLEYDFLEHILKIPVKYRINHNLYKKWIIKKYPQAANYVWEAIGSTISANTIKICNRSIPTDRLYWRISRKVSKALGLHQNKNVISKKNMNPIAYYYDNNVELKNYLDNYLKYVDSIENKQLHDDVCDLMTKGTAFERIQAISLLSAVKLFFSK